MMATNHIKKKEEGHMRLFKRLLLLTLVSAFIFIGANAYAKTCVYCSEGSPENFYPGVNTTGTSFDALSQIYSRLVEFERGGTAVVPGLAERWTVSPDGKEYTFQLRRGVKWHSNASFKPSRDMNADDIIFTIPLLRSLNFSDSVAFSETPSLSGSSFCWTCSQSSRSSRTKLIPVTFFPILCLPLRFRHAI